MKVSIVIPVYNVERYLDECVRSLLNLSIDFEIILVDDGSTDSSGLLCDNWSAKDARIKVIHQKNGGLSAARNTGINESNGEYVMFVDSDDFLDVEETNRMLQNLHEKPDVIMGLYRNFYTEEGRYENEYSPAFEKVKGLVSIDSLLSALPMDGTGCYMTAWRFVCRRDFLLKNDLYFMPGIYHEDEEWNQRLFCSIEKIFVSDTYFYQYRQARSGSITGKVNAKHIYDKFTIIKCGCALIHDDSVGVEQKRYIRKQLALIYLGNMIDFSILDKQEQETIWQDYLTYQELIKELRSRVGKLIRISQSVLGLKATCKLLGVVKRVLR